MLATMATKDIPTQAQVLKYNSVFGDPRGRSGGIVSAAWYQKNMGMIFPPFKMQMGTIPITKIAFHQLAAPFLARALDDIWSAAKEKQSTIDLWGMSKFSGAFNYRPMRGLDTLSMHSFGIAVDFDAANNGLGDQSPRFARFPEVLRCFAKHGFMWGGDWNGNGLSSDERRADGMHWQLTRRV